MKSFTTGLLLVLFLLIQSYSVSQTRIDKADFLNKSANSFMENVPNDIYSIVDRIEPDGSLKIKSDNLLSQEEILSVLGISNEHSFELTRENESYISSDIKYKYYQQYYKSIKVEGGGYLVTEKSGKIFKFSPNLYTNIDLDTNPCVVDSDIHNILGTVRIHSKELIISNRFDQRNKLMWIVNFTNEENKIVHIDAQNGTIYDIKNIKIPLLATTRNYGTVQLNNFSQNGVSSLSSFDNRIRIYQNINNMTPDWDSGLIPTTTDLTTWDTSPAWILSKQALYVTEKVDHEFKTKLGFTFPEIRVGTMLSTSAFALPNSNDILVGTLNFNPNGANFALFDVIAHELGHHILFSYLDYDPGYQNAVLHEGLADVYADYIENGILQGGTDWIMGNDDVDIRDMHDRNHAEFYCYDNNSSSDHERSKAISHWFYSITNGIQGTNISSIGGKEAAKNLTLEALNRINDFKAGVYHFRYLTLVVAQEMFGLNSTEYNSVYYAWQRVCITEQCPSSSQDIIINSNVPYITEQFIGGNIIIENGGTLEIINTNIYLKNDKFIQVKAGGLLKISNSTFNTCDGIGNWSGIIAEPNCTIDFKDVNLFNAKVGVHIKGNLNVTDFRRMNIVGNANSDAGIMFSGTSFIFGNIILPIIGNISGCKKGIVSNSANPNLTLRWAEINDCEIGIEVNGGNILLEHSDFNNCNSPNIIRNSSASINSNTVVGDFSTSIYCENSLVTLNSCQIGTPSHRGLNGIRASNNHGILINDTDIYTIMNGLFMFRTYFTVNLSTIDVEYGMTGNGIWTANCDGSIIDNNYISTNALRSSLTSYLNYDLEIVNNDISHEGPAITQAILGLGSHGNIISQNIIESNTATISLNNSSSNTMECNIIPSATKGIDIKHNSDLHTIKGNTINASLSDLQIQSVIGQQPHHGNVFAGGTAEAIGLDDQELILSQFKVNPSFQNHMPSNPIPDNGEWFVPESNPEPFNCDGIIIGPYFNEDICEYWKILKKIKDTQPNRFFINLYHVLYRAKKDTSFHLPDCIRLDTLLTQLCGVIKITDIFAELTKPSLDQNKMATLRQHGVQYIAETDENKKEEMRAMLHDEFMRLKEIKENNDSLRLDSLRHDLNLLECDSVIIQKWKEILLLYIKFRVNDSVAVADRRAVLDYSMHCDDEYGDAIYLARIMASTFTDEDFDQYDGCISPPHFQPKVSNVQDLLEFVKVFPNPGTGLINIEMPHSFTGLCTVMDIMGNQIFSKPCLNAQNVEIDLSNNPGLNLIQFTTDKFSSKIFKVVIIK
jgi:hypothetical protein